MPTKKAVLQQLFLREVNGAPITERNELSHCTIIETEFAMWEREEGFFI